MCADTSGAACPGPRDVQFVELYEQGLSLRRIAAATGASLPQIRRALSDAGVAVPMRGRGRKRPTTWALPPAEAAPLLRVLYIDYRMTRAQLALLFGVDEHRLRVWMRHVGIGTRTRGGANREDRKRLDELSARRLYVESGRTADEVAAATGHTRRDVLASLHETGLPVRVPNSAPREDHVLLDELYEDDLVSAAITKHGIPVNRRTGRLHERFPTPIELSPPMLREFYESCGLAAFHIELLTGHPQATVRRKLNQAGIPARPPGGLSPFRRRHRRRS